MVVAKRRRIMGSSKERGCEKDDTYTVEASEG